MTYPESKRTEPTQGEAMNTTTVAPATDSQYTYITDLLRKHTVPADFLGRANEAIRLRTLDRALASKTIDWLRRQPQVTRKAASANDVPEGFHIAGGEVYKVQVAVHGSGRKYAKVLDRETQTFVVASGAIQLLSADTAMTLEDAAKYGRTYNICARCGRTLTDEDSIERGVGPVCASKF